MCKIAWLFLQLGMVWFWYFFSTWLIDAWLFRIYQFMIVISGYIILYMVISLNNLWTISEWLHDPHEGPRLCCLFLVEHVEALGLLRTSKQSRPATSTGPRSCALNCEKVRRTQGRAAVSCSGKRQVLKLFGISIYCMIAVAYLLNVATFCTLGLSDKLW